MCVEACVRGNLIKPVRILVTPSRALCIRGDWSSCGGTARQQSVISDTYAVGCRGSQVHCTSCHTRSALNTAPAAAAASVRANTLDASQSLAAPGLSLLVFATKSSIMESRGGAERFHRQRQAEDPGQGRYSPEPAGSYLRRQAARRRPHSL